MRICPRCRQRSLRTWYGQAPDDPDDVDPRAECETPLCGYGY